MLIDWFTVGAQVFNFLILVWLLKRFLYQPILDAIDAREERIASELADADARKTEAGAERNAFEQKNARFEQARAGLLKEAEEAANSERQRLLEAAREEAAALSLKRQANLQTEAQALQREITQRTRQEVFAIARKALQDLAGASLEERMVAAFLARLEGLGEDERQALAKALKSANAPILVRSTFDLPPAQQASVQAAVQALLGGELALQFATTPDLVSGIELSSEGQKLAWSIAEYLRALENSLDEVLKAKAAPPVAGKGGADEP